MIIRVDARDFIKSINSVVGIVKDKALTDYVQLTSLYLQVHDNTLYLRGYDRTISFLDKIECRVINEEGIDNVYAVSSEKILKISKIISEGKIEIELLDNICKLQYGKYEWVINRVDIENANPLTELYIDKEIEGKFDVVELKSAIDGVGHIIDASVVNEMFRYLYIHKGNMFASNGKSVSFLKFNCENTIILSDKAVKCLSTVLDNLEGYVEVGVYDNEYVFRTPLTTFTVGIPVLEPFDIKELVSIDKKEFITIDKNKLTQAIQRCLVYSEEIIVRAEKGEFEVSAISKQGERASDTIEVGGSVSYEFKINGEELKNLISPIIGNVRIQSEVEGRILVESDKFSGVLASIKDE